MSDSRASHRMAPVRGEPRFTPAMVLMLGLANHWGHEVRSPEVAHFSATPRITDTVQW